MLALTGWVGRFGVEGFSGFGTAIKTTGGHEKCQHRCLLGPCILEAFLIACSLNETIVSPSLCLCPSYPSALS